MKFIKKPYLPEGKAIDIIANGLDRQSEYKLESMGISVRKLPDNPAADKRIAHHADISFCYLGDGKAVVAKEIPFACIDIPDDAVIYFSDKPTGSMYPDDVALNCIAIDKKLICNIDTVSPFVLQYFRERNFDIVNVRQGYTKCSVAAVSDNAIITDDESIARVCSECFDVLKVKKGLARLDGYDYGFIGGSAGKISYDTLAFTGQITDIEQKQLIEEFADKYGVKCVYLSDSPLYDIGSIIPITEE